MPRFVRPSATALLLLASLSGACRSTAPAPAAAPAALPSGAVRYDPPHALGALFHDVQAAGVLGDSKSFVDARPLAAPSEIAAHSAS